MSQHDVQILHCGVCGHSEEQHFNDGGDATSKYSCEAGNNDGSLCSCEDFALPYDPLEEFEPLCFRCERNAENCQCRRFAYDERDLYDERELNY